MFNDIGKKIKMIAWGFAILGIAIPIMIGIALVVQEYELAGCIVLIGGPIVFVVSAFLIYGFGQLVENSDKMAGNAPSSSAPAKSKKEDRFLPRL